ncbi:MAG: HEAT repeat domain-containing protein, partial [Planctomycetia bacterium]
SGALWDIAPEPKDALAKELVPVLAELQKEDNPDLRTEVVGLLSQMKSSEAVMALLQKASLDSDSSVGQIAAQNLVDNPDSAIEALVKGLASKDVQVRFRSVSNLAQMGERAAKAMPALVETLRDRDVGVRWESALALGRMKAKAKEAVQPLTEALEDPAYQVRMMAAEALGEIGSEASGALEALKIAQKDSRAEVVDAARIAIRKISK